jgi:hypothetical protein
MRLRGLRVVTGPPICVPSIGFKIHQNLLFVPRREIVLPRVELRGKTEGYYWYSVPLGACTRFRARALAEAHDHSNFGRSTHDCAEVDRRGS